MSATNGYGGGWDAIPSTINYGWPTYPLGSYPSSYTYTYPIAASKDDIDALKASVDALTEVIGEIRNRLSGSDVPSEPLRAEDI